MTDGTNLSERTSMFAKGNIAATAKDLMLRNIAGRLLVLLTGQTAFRKGAGGGRHPRNSQDGGAFTCRTTSSS